MLNKTTWPTGLFLCCSALTLWQLEQQGSSNKLNSFQAKFSRLYTHNYSSMSNGQQLVN